MNGRVPRIYRSEAVVLRTRRLGEADRIVTLYTPQFGKLDAVAKGVRRQTSRKSGHLEPLTWASLQLAHGRNLDIITQGETVESFLPLRENLQRVARGLYVAELVDRFTEPRVENYRVFLLLADTLRRLATGDALDLTVRYFELQLLSHMGYRPQLSSCVVCASPLAPVVNGFSAALGGVVCTSCRHTQAGLRPLSVNALKVLRLLQTGGLDRALQLRLSSELSVEMEAIVRSAIHHVLEQSPRSLGFVEAVRGSSVPERAAPLMRVAEPARNAYAATPSDGER